MLLQNDFDAQSIPTEMELIQNGCFDDMVRDRERTAIDDSKILSSILQHDSSNW